MRLEIMLVFSLLLPAITRGELSDIEIDEIRATYRQQRLNVVVEALDKSESLSDWPSELAPLLDLIENETSDSRRFRWNVCAEIYKHASSDDISIQKKRELVWLLSTRLKDRDSYIRSRVVSWLRNFDSESFIEDAQRNIKETFHREMTKNAILLMGVVDPEYCMSKTEDLLQDTDIEEQTGEKFWSTPSWASRLVHARYGDAESIDRILNSLEHEPNENIRVVRLFRDLGYVHQPKVVEYLKQQVVEGKVIPSGPDFFGISYAREACAVLNTMLKNFPQPAGRRYRASDIAVCREWLLQQETWFFHE